MMYRVIFSVSLVCLMLSAHAQSDRYAQAMQQTLSQLQAAETVADLQTVAGQMSRIASAEPDSIWPSYYRSLALLRAAYEAQKTTPDQANVLLGQVEPHITAALTRWPEESEWHVLQAYAFQLYIVLDPMQGMVYSPKVQGSLKAAQQLNSNNPRAWYIHGQHILYMPSFAGGGAERALPLLERAVEAYDAWESPAVFWPSWGEGAARYLLSQATPGE